MNNFPFLPEIDSLNPNNTARVIWELVELFVDLALSLPLTFPPKSLLVI